MRKLPYNTEAEQAVLGAMLLSKMAIEEAMGTLTPNAFYLPEHQIIYKAIVALYDNHNEVDITTVTTHLVELEQLNNVGGVEYLTSLADSVFTASNIKYYIDIVYDKALSRRLIEVSEKLASTGYENQMSAVDYLQEAEKLILDVTRNRNTSDFHTAPAVIEYIQENLQKLAAHSDGITGTPTGFKDIDNLTNGLQPGDLIILAARPAVGKTAFALNLAKNAAHLSKKAVAVFSLEMGADQLMNRMISATGRIEGQKLRTGQFETEDWLKFSKATSELKKDPIFIDDSAGIKVAELASKCRKLDREHDGLALIVIDYLQLISGSDNSRESRQVEVSEISRALKGLARELKVPVIALSQLSRGVEARTDKRPMMSDLRESGAIEQDADIVCFLYRDDYYTKEESEHPGAVELIFGKHRNGATGTIELAFEKDINKFSSVERSVE